MKKSLFVLCLSVGLLTNTARGNCYEGNTLAVSVLGISLTIFVASVMGMVFSRAESNCFDKQVVCLDDYVCSPQNAYPCLKVFSIGSHHFVNSTSQCQYNHAFCISKGGPVTPANVVSAFYQPSWAKLVSPISWVSAVYSAFFLVASGAVLVGSRLDS